MYISNNGINSTVQPSKNASSASGATYVGALFTFNTTIVNSRVGISWISKDQACQNVKSQIPKGTTFNSVVEDTKKIWNSEILSKITTTATNITSLELLYTSLYFMNLLPTNQTGENPGWKSSEPYWQDIFTFWDTFRCSTSLMHIITPTAYAQFIRSLIDIWRYDGYLPDGRSSNYNGRTQGGSNADNVLADAYVKGVRDGINWKDGYAAMVKNAEVTPSNPIPDAMAPDSSTKEGRGALPDWLKHGFITTRFSRSVSRAIEYAYNDFSLYQVAQGLGNKSKEAKKYLKRSQNWRNHWNPDTEALGSKGFMMPRNETSFLSYDPLASGGYWQDPFYQASSFIYSFGDIHDMATLVKRMGGEKGFLDRLDTVFRVGGNPANPNGVLYDSTNQPSFNLGYLYNFINRADRSVLQTRQVAKNDFDTSPRGLPGNSDAGAMQTWLLWNMIGLYPITGQTTFLIHGPWFDSMTIDLGNRKSLKITATGGDGNGDTNIYVQSLKVNGKKWNKNWLTWDDVFKKGGTMEYVLGPEPTRWDTGKLPPSPAS